MLCIISIQNEHYNQFPAVTVIIPMFNAAKYIRRSVDSVLNQTYPNVIILLMNDGSTDDTQIFC
jgi:glycosyltransferase involved in cell wall biosynthesis